MLSSIPTVKKRAFRNALELKLRRSRGDMLQHFLAAVAAKVWGDNFIPATAHYTRGDLKCDGLLRDPLTIFACYGPTNGGDGQSESATSQAVGKVLDDFIGALEEWPELKQWVFVNNYVTGVPPQITAKLLTIDSDYPRIEIIHMGMAKFAEMIFTMSIEDVEELLGDAASEDDFRALQLPEIQLVIADVMARLGHTASGDDQPVVVPAEKLEFNNLSHAYRDFLKLGFQNASRVENYLLENYVPTLGQDVARAFKGKYLELKSQKLTPDAIMDELYDFALAGHNPTTMRQVAIWSLLAYLFEKCTIFEDKPVLVARVQ
jgi:ABC-3C protein